MANHGWQTIAAMTVLLCRFAMAQTAPGPGAWVETRGARVHVPDGWSYNERLLAASGPLNLTNFRGVYAAGGLPPRDGAEVEVTSVAAPPDLMEYIKQELKAAQVDRFQEMSIGEKSGVKAVYAQAVPGGALKTTVIYVPHGGSLYKFHLTYWAGNRSERALAGVFEQVLKEAQLR